MMSILRILSQAGPAASDAELLRQFTAHGDEEAFAGLVQRHGGVVWSVCRNLAGADAEDAFQATFLILFKNAGKAGIAKNLSAWLHRVAFRVCLKARRSAQRRTKRESASSTRDNVVSVVADSTWDRAMAAVHEEIVKLPESLRAAFVLCTLEGMSVGEAAAHQKCKLSTFSARLNRAKDAILARLAPAASQPARQRF